MFSAIKSLFTSPAVSSVLGGLAGTVLPIASSFITDVGGGLLSKAGNFLMDAFSGKKNASTLGDVKQISNEMLSDVKNAGRNYWSNQLIPATARFAQAQLGRWVQTGETVSPPTASSGGTVTNFIPAPSLQNRPNFDQITMTGFGTGLINPPTAASYGNPESAPQMSFAFAGRNGVNPPIQQSQYVNGIDNFYSAQSVPEYGRFSQPAPTFRSQPQQIMPVPSQQALIDNQLSAYQRIPNITANNQNLADYFSDV